MDGWKEGGYPHLGAFVDPNVRVGQPPVRKFFGADVRRLVHPGVVMSPGGMDGIDPPVSLSILRR